jgi:hypothetical protein
MMLWTVARFPNGSWTSGGKPNDPDYALCEVWRIEADSRTEAVRKAQAKRSRERAKARASAASTENGQRGSGE